MAAAARSLNDTYMKLIQAFPLRRIRSAADHTKAKRLVLRLSSQETDRGTSEFLDILVDLVADYEKRSSQTADARSVSPAALVRHRLDERGTSVSALARIIGIPQSNLSEMLRGKRQWSKTAIRGVSEHLHIRVDRFFT